MKPDVTVKMDHFKECVNSHRFQESTEGSKPATIGSIYVPKKTLQDIGWKYGQPIYVTVAL